MFNYGDSNRTELYAAITAISSCMQLAVVVQVVLTVELVFSTEFAREAVRSLAVETTNCQLPITCQGTLSSYSRLFVTLEMLIAPECLAAARIVARAHGSSNNVDL